MARVLLLLTLSGALATAPPLASPSLVFGGLGAHDFVSIQEHDYRIRTARAPHRGAGHIVVRSSNVRMDGLAETTRLSVSGMIGSGHVLVFQDDAMPLASKHVGVEMNCTHAAAVHAEHKYSRGAVIEAARASLATGPGWSIGLAAYVTPTLTLDEDRGAARAAKIVAAGTGAALSVCRDMAVSSRWVHHGADAVGTASAFVRTFPLAFVALRFRAQGGSQAAERCAADAVLAAAAAIADFGVVYFVEANLPEMVQNLHASALLQTGTSALPNSPDSTLDARAYHAAGFNGTGEIVGMRDTGVDFDMCYFRDDARPVPIDHLDRAHRKIVYLQTAPGTGRDTRDTNGHGTHVAASIAGCSVSAGSGHDGVAPGAKLHVLDSGVGWSQSLAAVDDLETEVLLPAYESGARIASHSWGLSSASLADMYYASQVIASSGMTQVDAFQHSHPDHLALFCAGNDGGYLSTVLSPSTAKNSISVGATSHTRQSWEARGLPNHLPNDLTYWSHTALAQFSAKGPTIDMRYKPDLVAPGDSIDSALSDGVDGTNNCGTTHKV